MNNTIPINMGARYRIDYTNYEGKRSVREITPIQFFWGSNHYHTEPQMLLNATCHVAEGLRTFAVKDIHSMEPVA
jgi:predicted DNA-binding transcriptional regulator YafY